MITKKLTIKFLKEANISVNGQGPCDIRVHDKQFFRRLSLNPSLGAGESYVEGLWDCDNLDELFCRICQKNLDQKLTNKYLSIMYRFLNKCINLQTRKKSKKVAEIHYNLGNDFYSHMLGKSMAYTCAYWKNATTLDQAQFDKFELICRKIDLQPTDRVLDLGCGWGSLAKYMAEKYGCEVVGVNISTEQVRYARESTKNLPVKIHLCDYRDAATYNPEGRPFDKIVSVGLCEHIGHKNYKPFMKVVRQNLKEEGLFLLHTIGKNNSDIYLDPWTNKYIFPNGLLPSIKFLSGAAENLFVIEDLHNFGADYDKTLMAWHKNFNDNWHLYKDLYGQNFFRLWNYYLLSCAGGFRSRGMQLWQMVLSPKGVRGGYVSKR